ncbi:HD domain-containing protein [Pseudoxanthomonas sp. 10H]|uniref:HD domain-containing protein n=1 Tax=Pseudoxanthomonas sp. 10H TaxID=3242729 RepID=UPI0035564858
MAAVLPLVEAILDHHADAIASDLPGYRNHVLRVIALMDAIAPLDPDDHAVVATAAAFHDIGLWTARRWDYIPPSIAAAGHWLREHAREADLPLVREMIVHHHKLTPCPPGTHPLVEHFRRADWCDVSGGLHAGGVPAARYREVRRRWPSLGFHRRLAGLALRHAWRQPLRPFPMLRL